LAAPRRAPARTTPQGRRIVIYQGCEYQQVALRRIYPKDADITLGDHQGPASSLCVHLNESG
jgi:hypothetical protein